MNTALINISLIFIDGVDAIDAVSCLETGSLSDEPLRSYANDAVPEGSASTSRLAPNRALSLCRGVALTVDCLWPKFGHCSSNGSRVIDRKVTER